MNNRVSKVRTSIFVFLMLGALDGLAVGFFFPTYGPFLYKYLKSAFLINAVNFFYFLGSAVFDPPTGNLADKYGRRKIYVLGMLFWALSFYAYYRSTDFWGFVGAELLGAVGAALKSEALEAWLRNTFGREVTFKALTDSGIVSSSGVIAGALVSGVITAHLGLEVGWLMSFWATVISLCVFGVWLQFLPASPKTVPNSQSADGIGGGDGIDSGVRSTFRYTLRHQTLLVLILAYSLLQFAFMPVNMYWSLIAKDRGISSELLGAMVLVITIPPMIGALMARKKFILTPSFRGVFLTFLITGIPLIFVMFTKGIPVYMLLFLFHEFGRGAARPIFHTVANDYIPDHVRSTANSIISAARTLGGALGLLLLGLLAEYTSFAFSWFVSGVVLLIGGLLLAMLIVKRKR